MIFQDIIIDGVSGRSIGLKFEKLPLWACAHEQTINYDTTGRHQALHYKSGFYNPFTMTFTAYLINGAQISDVYRWVNAGKKVILSTQPDRYGIIRNVQPIFPSRIGQIPNKIDISIEFEPFKYAVDNTPITTPSERTESLMQVFKTIGNIYSEPLIVLKGVMSPEDTGYFTITVNGVEIKLQHIYNDVYIDIPRRKIYQKNDEYEFIVQERTTGNFWDAVLVPSDTALNVVSVDGVLLRGMEIHKNERWI